MIGDNIKRLMKENGYTQRQLAMRSACTESAISRYIRNEREPNIRILKNLAIALGVTVDELISEKESKKISPTKARYYNADTLIEFVRLYTPHFNGKTTMQCVERAINEAPAVDVVSKSEVDRLQNSLDISRKETRRYLKRKEEIKSEVVRDFAEEVKLEFYREFDEIIPSIMAEKIDELVKKYTEVCTDCRYFVGCECFDGKTCDLYTKGGAG